MTYRMATVEQSDSVSAELAIALTRFGTFWTSIPGSARHFLNSKGEVLSMCGKPRLLKGSLAGEGYRFVQVAPDVRHYIHHLMCEWFNGPRPGPTHQVRHLDGNRTRNVSGNISARLWGFDHDGPPRD